MNKQLEYNVTRAMGKPYVDASDFSRTNDLRGSHI